MNYFVYIHIFPNGKRYVGLTSQNPERRWSKGIGYKLYRRQYQLPVYHAINKYGWENVKHIVYEVETESEMKYLEKYLISYYNTRNRSYGYNITSGGDGMLGFKHSPEAIERMRLKHKGWSSWNKGIPMSTSTRYKLSIAKGSKIIQYDLTGAPIKTFDSFKQIRQELGFCYDTVSKHIHLDTPFRGYIFKKAPLKEPN